MASEQFIERRIITGLITSTEYVQKIYSVLDLSLLTAEEARILCGWCLEYFHQYGVAPNKDIEGIYTKKLREKRLGDKESGWIAELLGGLSDEYDPERFNVQFLYNETLDYLQERKLETHYEQIEMALERGNIAEAQKIASGWTPVAKSKLGGIDPFAMTKDEWVDVFSYTKENLIHFPGVFGDMVNPHMAPDCFVAFMGSEKRGKTFILLECTMRALRQHSNVAFFQAGDMTEQQFLKRIAIYQAQRSDKKQYCAKMYIPIKDCVYHQIDDCDSDRRQNSDCVPFEGKTLDEMKKGVTYPQLEEAFAKNKKHVTCHNCGLCKTHGAVWWKVQEEKDPLDAQMAFNVIKRVRKKYRKKFKLSTHANGTLTVGHIKTQLQIWEKEDNFIPRVIVIDYADIMAADVDFRGQEERHRQNHIWSRLRGVSQEFNVLVITATQADAKSYDQSGLLAMKNFSEDKRKYSHVTAMYGLNQTAEQKKIGLMQVNEIVIREGDFDNTKPVTLLQRLQKGRPFLGSFW